MYALRSAPLAPWEQKGFWVGVRRIRQDATNSDFWKGKKLSVTELFFSGSTRQIFADTPWSEVSAGIETKCILGDLKPVQGSSTGKSCLGIVESQIKSIASSGDSSVLPWLVGNRQSPELKAIHDAPKSELLSLHNCVHSQPVEVGSEMVVGMFNGSHGLWVNQSFSVFPVLVFIETLC
jgi:hypothetical protein